jgi:hypothetical protein
VPNGRERKTLEVYEDCGEDKKKSAARRQWAGRNCVIKNFIITYSVPIKCPRMSKRKIKVQKE